MGVNMMLVFMIEREEIFIDTSANFAIVNKKDIDYQIAVKFLKEVAEKKCTLISTNFIIDETYTLIMRKIGRRVAIKYIKDFRDSVVIINVIQTDEEKAWDIISKYEDKDYTYTDATSFAIMGRLGIRNSWGQAGIWNLDW